MSDPKQIFQTASKLRWRTFQWTTRVLLLGLAVMVPVVLITLARAIKPVLPQLSNPDNALHKLVNPTTPLVMNDREFRKYKGFDAFLKAKQRLQLTAKKQRVVTTSKVRAAFYVDWDPQSFYSLQQNINKLNMVVPEWFFIDPNTDTLKPSIDMAALQLMQKNHVSIVPLINNINPKKGAGEFDGQMLHRILHSPAKKQRLLNDIVFYINKYHLQGINIDFEEFVEKSDEPMVSFQKELYETLHAKGLLVSQDIMPSNSDFNLKALANYNDYLFLMAYDEHYSTSVPGPVSGQQWIEKVLDETAALVPPDKIVVCFAGYGYDWAAGNEAVTITYQQGLANARQYNATIDFEYDHYNNTYQYTDEDKLKHTVYFADAATNFNTIRFADEYGAAGTALWRLGSEDDRLWTYYNRSLTNQALAEHPFNYSLLKNVTASVEKPDYIGDGEVLNILSRPQQGNIQIRVDSTEGMIAAEKYIQLPTRYVIQKYGNVHNQVILTFDDGPDPDYTPQVLDILKEEKVPATFFVVGMEAENNLPLLRRIFNEGHEIGNHTFTHPNIALVSADRAAKEIESTRLLIEAVTGRSTVLFRAPYNADAEPTTAAELKPVSISRLQNYYTIGESIDPNDWEPGTIADSIYVRTIRQYEANPTKGIILLHDAGGHRQATVDALPRIIHYFKSKGIQFTTVANLLHTTKAVIMPPVNNSLLQLDGNIASVGYWLEQLLVTAFWLAIVLGFVRIAAMAVMAFL